MENQLCKSMFVNMKHLFCHGTSSLFLESIKRYGLGGINPNFDYKLLELLCFLYEISELYLQHNKEYLEVRATTKAMVFQEPLLIEEGKFKGFHSFEHKNIYLSFGEYRAVTYSLCSEYGSEILTRIIYLYRLLKQEIKQVIIPPSINLINVDMVEKKRYSPIVVGINDINSQYLQTEYGESAKESILTILKMKDELDSETFCKKVQCYNFRLIKPVPPSKLTFYRVLYPGSRYNVGSDWSIERI